MSLIDENIARLFLQVTPLKEAVLKTIDLDSTEKKIQQFETYVESVLKKPVLENQEKLLLQEEIQWSLSQCNKYLRFFDAKDEKSDLLQIENHNRVIEIIKNYIRVLKSITF